MKYQRQALRRFAFEQAFVDVNTRFEIPPGKTAGRDAPTQYSLTRKYRRRIARNTLQVQRKAAK